MTLFVWLGCIFVGVMILTYWSDRHIMRQRERMRDFTVDQYLRASYLEASRRDDWLLDTIGEITGSLDTLLTSPRTKENVPEDAALLLRQAHRKIHEAHLLILAPGKARLDARPASVGKG